MSAIPLEHGLILAVVLFALGLAGLLVRRNIIFALASIEIMLNAAGLAFVVAGAHWGQVDGQVFFIFILAMAATEVSVGLALALLFRRHFGTLDLDRAALLRDGPRRAVLDDDHTPADIGAAAPPPSAMTAERSAPAAATSTDGRRPTRPAIGRARPADWTAHDAMTPGPGSGG